MEKLTYSINGKSFTIRQMERKDLDIAVEWAAKEGWNPGIYDAETFYLTDPKGFFIGELDNEPVGCISAVAYDDNFGFIGFFMVKPEYRGSRFGPLLGQAGMSYLGNRNIGLDGVMPKQKNYEYREFKLAYKNVRYEGIAQGKVSNNVIDIAKLPFEKVLAYDNEMFPASRPVFLKSWINQPECKALGVLQDDRLVGYGVIRICRTGYKIGPLFADTPDLAEDIFNALTSYVNSSLIYLDIPEVNSAAQKLVDSHNMKKAFETVRMYNKEAPNLPLNKLFGVTTFELG